MKRQPADSELFEGYEPPVNPAIEMRRREREAHPKRLPNRRAAQKAVERAVRRGQLVAQPCEECGDEPTQAHHPSYEPGKWLDVVWLCKVCHEMAHHGGE
jgi:hypothetical protein